jgi:hypothetical protein
MDHWDEDRERAPEKNDYETKRIYSLSMSFAFRGGLGALGKQQSRFTIGLYYIR